VVEDNDDDVFIIRKFLDQAPEVRAISRVDNGKAALDYMRKLGPYEDEHTPHLVLLDINMPGMNGFEILQEMRTDPLLRLIPVIVLSTSGRPEDVQRAYFLGANAYLVKSGELQLFGSDLLHFASFWGRVARLPERSL
jgi:CheY-like chemotaxis protein